MDTFDYAVQLISNLGFPIFVSIWLLHRFDRRQEEMKMATLELSSLIRELCLRVSDKK